MENQLYAIMALKPGTERKFLIATFDEYKDAIEYIRRAKMNKRMRARTNPGQVYRPDSLLKKYTDAWVEIYESHTPHNPYLERLRRTR